MKKIIFILILGIASLQADLYEIISEQTGETTYIDITKSASSTNIYMYDSTDSTVNPQVYTVPNHDYPDQELYEKNSYDWRDYLPQD